MKKPVELPEKANNFLTTFQRHRGGALLEEASAKLAELTAAVHDTGKGGTMTITIKVKPASRGVDAVVLSDTCKIKAPEIQAEESFWFANGMGELSKEDPKQRQMFPAGVVEGGRKTDREDQANVA